MQHITVRPGTVTAAVSVHDPRVSTHSRFEDGEEITAGSTQYRTIWRCDGGAQSQDFAGSPPRNEEDVLDVCRALRARLNIEGGSWERFRETAGSTDVDATSSNEEGEALHVQVTRVEQSSWEALANHGHTTVQVDSDTLSTAIRNAIDKKARKHTPVQRECLLLVLDALRSPGHATDAAVYQFRRQYGEWAMGLGYSAIWLVGPGSDMTHRLA